jgi:hypothetical protein
MSRYYFHIRDGDSLIHDDEGMECRDLAAAMEEALFTARDLALTALASGTLRAPATVEIEDEDGNVVGADDAATEGGIAKGRVLH